MMSSVITERARAPGVKVLPQVIDAKEDNGDCQPEHLSRKLTGTQPRIL